MSFQPRVYRVKQPITRFGAKPGDFLLVRLGHRQLLTLHRYLCLCDLVLLSDSDAVELVPEVQGPTDPPSHPPGQKARVLELVK